MNRKVLFLKTIEDIEDKLRSDDPYKTLLIAGLLRKLLLDQHPLVVQVNKEFGLKIKYTINDRPRNTQFKNLAFWAIQDGFDPETAQMSVPREVNISKLLSQVVMIINGQEFSVKDLLDQLNNIAGSVHASGAKTEKQKILEGFGESFMIGGMDPVIRSLKSISRVILKGLKPLVDQLSDIQK